MPSSSVVALHAMPAAQPEEGRLTEIVVIPRSGELEEAEVELSRALVTVVGGTRPLVSTTMVRQHLCALYGLSAESF